MVRGVSFAGEHESMHKTLLADKKKTSACERSWGEGGSAYLGAQDVVLHSTSQMMTISEPKLTALLVKVSL